MCLTLNDKPREPLRKGNIRYKLLLRPWPHDDLVSIYYAKKWKIGKRLRSCNIALEKLQNQRKHDAGFHVFTTYKDALQARSRIRYAGIIIIVAVEVDTHIASGYWSYCVHDEVYNAPSETWKYAKMVKVYN